MNSDLGYSFIGEIISVDFLHPDCGGKQMLLKIRAPEGVVRAGLVELRMLYQGTTQEGIVNVARREARRE